MSKKTARKIEDQEQYSLFRPEEVGNVQMDLFQGESDQNAPAMWSDLFGK